MRSARPLALVAALTLVMLSCTVAMAGLPSSNPDNTQMVNGQVRAFAQVGTDTWIGGSFTEVLDQSGNPLGPAGGLAAFTSAGVLDPAVTLPLVTLSTGPSFVYGLSLAPNGDLYLAGHFDAVNGVPRSNVAAVDPSDGSLLPFNPGTAEATAILATSSQILVGTGKLLSFQPNGAPTSGFFTDLGTNPALRHHFTKPQVRRIVAVGSRVMIACQCDSLTDANGTHDVKAVVKIDPATGDWIDWKPSSLSASSPAFGLSLVVEDAPGTTHPTVYLAAGGSDFVAAYDYATGTQLWREDVSGSAQDILWWQGDLIVGGHFDWTQTPTSAQCGEDAKPNKDCYHSPRLVAINAGTGHIVLKSPGKPWNPGICCAYNGVWALWMDPNGTSVHVGGQFTKAGGNWVFNGTAHQWQLKGAATQHYYARFSAPLPGQSLKVTLSGGGSGTVLSSPAGISCPGTCTKKFAGGVHVTLRAVAHTASTFTGWTGSCSGTDPTCDVTMTAARNVGATFARGSACGRILFVSTRTGNADIFVVNANGSGLKNLTASDPAADTDPAWSRDCQTIAFASTRVGGRSHVFLMHADGSSVQQLTSGAGADTQPTWSPDGAKIAFTGSSTGRRQIYSITTDGSMHLRRLTHDQAVDVQPAWSPSGTKILFVSNRYGHNDLFAMASDGSHRMRITHGLRPSAQPSWSPNGARVAFVSAASGSPQIWIMKANFHGALRLTKDGKTDTHPTWAPRGTRIAYASTRSGKVDVWTIAPNGSGATRLTSNPHPDSSPSWS